MKRCLLTLAASGGSLALCNVFSRFLLALKTLSRSVRLGTMDNQELTIEAAGDGLSLCAKVFFSVNRKT